MIVSITTEYDNSNTTLAICDDETKSELYNDWESWPYPRLKYCSYHIMITNSKVKVYLLVPNYNYSNPLNSMNIVDFIDFYNPNIINPHIKLLPKIETPYQILNLVL